MNKLLTKEEIQLILTEAKNNPQWQIPTVMNFVNNRNKTNIITISPAQGIIIINGDSHTGFNHIKERHDYWSIHSYFKQHQGDLKVDNPSKFGKKSIPIIDYQDIIDQLYNSDNLDIEKNKRPEVFDLYRGIVTNENNGSENYTMLLYKDTKILHTLFPKSKKNNETKKETKTLKYAKGKVQCRLHFKPFVVVVISIPYRDNKGVAHYSFEIIREYEKKIEIAMVRDLKIEGFFEVYTVPLEEKFDQNKLDMEIKDFRFNNLTKIEKFIKKYDLETYGNQDE